MPFGAEVRGDGSVRFRLWAPAAARVDVHFADGGETLPMERADGGWYERLVPGCRGRGYRFRIDGGLSVPDPASRCNPEDTRGFCLALDPQDFDWDDADWRGRPWHEAVIYEIHVGAFSPPGNFAGVAARLDELAGLGITAIELMPIGDFPGRCNWGYDGVLPFAPDSTYGTPDELKALVCAAHRKGLMVLLDVVYNHFGPEHNYLHCYAPQFFDERRQTPWGAAIAFAGSESRTVRDFFIHNALYWLEEYHFDGLRLDAVHAIDDAAAPDFLSALAAAVHDGPGRRRTIHLVLENDHNAARYLDGDAGAAAFTAQWNDDLHHALHVLLTGERHGHYADYADDPLRHLGRCLAEGFAWQGEPSAFRGGRRRGEPSRRLPPTAFVAFLQNHDQVGNRAGGERLITLCEAAALRAAAAIVLLAPSPPLLFMGEEFGARSPFPFFCDFSAPLQQAVEEGRRRELARDPPSAAPAALLDSSAAASFAAAKLDWARVDDPPALAWRDFHRELLALRRREIVPRLAGSGGGGYERLAGSGLRAWRQLGDGSRLTLLANLGDAPLGGIAPPKGELIHPVAAPMRTALHGGHLPPWTAAWFLDRTGRAP